MNLQSIQKFISEEKYAAAVTSTAFAALTVLALFPLGFLFLFSILPAVAFALVGLMRRENMYALSVAIISILLSLFVFISAPIPINF